MADNLVPVTRSGDDDEAIDVDLERMDLGGAWWHLGGDDAPNAPMHVVGVDFRDGGWSGVGGGGLVLRFATDGARAADASSSRGVFSASVAGKLAGARAADAAMDVDAYANAAVVPAHHVSSALIKVEPPTVARAAADRVVVDASNNGGISYSDGRIRYHKSAPA